MKSIRLIFIIASLGILISLIVCASNAQTTNEKVIPLADEIIKDIASGRIERADILITPENLETRTAVDEQALDKISTRMTIAKVSREKHTPLLVKALQDVRLDFKCQNLDLRYGCQFFDAKGKIMHTLYIDQFRQLGKLDGKRVICLSELVNWICVLKGAK